MTEEQIKHMVDRFLGWRLPENFNPDCGISFDADAARKINPRNIRLEPIGTNLFDATQAEVMVRHMLVGLPPEGEIDAPETPRPKTILEKLAESNRQPVPDERLSRPRRR